MTKMNQSGQAFSVFKLLIAAIVAVFILALLLQILSNITPPSQGDPTDEAASKIKTLITKLGTPERTAVVTFGAGTILTAKTIANKTGALGTDNVCVIVGSADSSSDIFKPGSGNNAGKTIEYTGNSNVQRRLYILCDLGSNFNGSGGTSTWDDLQGIGLVDEAFANNGDCQIPDNSNRYCVVSIIPPGTG